MTTSTMSRCATLATLVSLCVATSTPIVPLSSSTTAPTTAKSDEQATNSTSETNFDGGVGQGGPYPFRDLPADVLRDFPNLCFGSTALRLFEVGHSWSLKPFCGVATCILSQDGYLIERVTDCGRQPLPNPKCKNVNFNAQAQYPDCCPRYECEDGVQLEYPNAQQLQQLAIEAAQAAVKAQQDEEGLTPAPGADTGEEIADEEQSLDAQE